MKVTLIRSMKSPDKSIIFVKDNNTFAPWHNHPEYELVLVTKGQGNRIVGDKVDRFYDNDLVLTGPYTPHEFLCDPEYINHPDGFQGECIFIQFPYNFIGEKFFDIPENDGLKRFLIGSSLGYEFFGETKNRIISIILEMVHMNDTERLYSLLSIFKIFSTTREVKTLSSHIYEDAFWLNQNDMMQKALKYILQNYSKKIYINDLLNITNMSKSGFYSAFKKTYRMSFRDYLLNIRVGCACKLLTEESVNISGVAYKSGFENISNFNRQFKKIKGITPSEFQEKVRMMEL